MSSLVRMIDPGYLRTMQIPLLAGRAFAASDDSGSEPVIILNERLARTLWPNEDAIGRYVRSSGTNRRVVGVVGDVRYFGLDRGTDFEMYMPLSTGDYQSVDLVVRAAIPPTALASGIRAALHRVDPTLPVAEFRTMQQLVDRSVFARRFVAMLVAAFAAFGLILASLGIYAVISYSVTLRTQEISIRMALGATPRVLLASILGQTGMMVVLGSRDRAVSVVRCGSRDSRTAVRRRRVGSGNVHRDARRAHDRRAARRLPAGATGHAGRSRARASRHQRLIVWDGDRTTTTAALSLGEPSSAPGND